MRYLLQFPLEKTQVSDQILPDLETENSNDEVELEVFLPKMVDWIMMNAFHHSEEDELMAAFELLDPQKTGLIPIEIFQELMKLEPTYLDPYNQNIVSEAPLRKREMDNMIGYALDKTGKFIDYASYV